MFSVVNLGGAITPAYPGARSSRLDQRVTSRRWRDSLCPARLTPRHALSVRFIPNEHTSDSFHPPPRVCPAPREHTAPTRRRRRTRTTTRRRRGAGRRIAARRRRTSNPAVHCAAHRFASARCVPARPGRRGRGSACSSSAAPARRARVQFCGTWPRCGSGAALWRACCGSVVALGACSRV